MIDKTENDLSCYVIITCENPSSEGRMNVQMSYEGDPLLVSYLLETGLKSLREKDISFD